MGLADYMGMNEQASAIDRPSGARALEFARTEMFERTFKEGMSLVEETAAYLDGPGRAASKRLSRASALGYAGESMRLTTHLMQVASWLLVQRALRDGNMTFAEASDEKYRFSGRERSEAGALSGSELPEDLRALIVRADGLYERVRRLDEKMYGWGEEAPANQVTNQMDRLRAAIESGAFRR
jgi:regulator of CtrA degradation